MSFVVGLTGGIGSGKSAAASEFERLGASIVDTDAIAHALTRAGGAAIPELARIFGSDMLGEGGAMDRDRMRERVFADPAARQALEAVLHPMIREESRRLIAAAQGPYVIHVVPLLVESDYRRRVDRVLVIDVPEELQVERVRARSGLSEAQVRAILASQATRADRLAAADDVIENRGTIDALRKQVAAFHQKYLQYSKAARS
ncbi:MAG TPA: dephospho-CoA kinase [Burkholderiales bacterium]|nr:dephospho-CoA kinase [Burkholderiales bacterium]